MPEGYNERKIPHIHLLKGQSEHTELSEYEFHCIFDAFKKYEKENNLCQDGKTQCLLGDEDAEKIKKGYSVYLRQQKQSLEIKTEAEKIYAEFEKNCISGLKNTKPSSTNFIFNSLNNACDAVLGKMVSYARNVVEDCPHYFDCGSVKIQRETIQAMGATMFYNINQTCVPCLPAASQVPMIGR